jgi:hypothetical protein
MDRSGRRCRHVKNVLLVGTVHADLDGFGRLEAVLEASRPRTIAVEMNAQRGKFFEGCGSYDALSTYRDAQRTYERILQLLLSRPAVLEVGRARYAGASVAPWTARQIAAVEAGMALLRACHGFEVKVAARYVEQHPGTELHYIDLPENEVVDAVGASTAFAGGLPAVQLNLFADNQALLDHGLLGFVTLLRDLQDVHYAEAGGELRRRYERAVAGWSSLPQHDHFRRAVYHPRREPYMAQQIRLLRRANPSDRCVVIVGATHRYGISSLLGDCEHSSMLLSEAARLEGHAA